MNASTIRPLYVIGIVLLAFTVTALVTSCIRAEMQNAHSLLPILGELHGKGNEVLEVMGQDALLIDIRSETGIGSVTLTVTAALPTTVTLRLHLPGLEHLQVSNGVNTVVAQVVSRDDQAVSQALAQAQTPAAAAEPINQNHPMWLAIEPRNKTTPYYTIILPPAFLAEIKQTLTIAWVDFYR